jgi:hypothetical protein
MRSSAVKSSNHRALLGTRTEPPANRSDSVGIKRVFEREYGGWLSVFGEGHHPDNRATLHCANFP